eukprot:TRINITY_DN4004_c0_g1_i10.p1 TRINITY_DN4004_c0_g1~~TRINITY_DN4004_c0_g1_i10.p1  ORF type:complete len:1490 (-),score=239.07 TRINITY_DN4004_c0_g1_i10:1700-6169(-)
MVVWLLFYLLNSVHGADPPRVLAVLPDSSSLLYKREPITIVFSSSVIALGQNWANVPAASNPFRFSGHNSFSVPGRVRWVTTSIARFDPDVDWPEDLEFYVTPEVTTFQGAKIISSPVKFLTPSSSFSIVQIKSEQAYNKTGGTWWFNSSHTSLNLPECPPDGKIYLYFSSDISPELQSTLKIVQKDSDKQIPFKTEPCKISWGNEQQCIILVPIGALEVDTTYDIIVPINTVVSKYGGTTKNEIIQSFSGLHSFRFYFNEIHERKLGAPNFWLNLIHGLARHEDVLLIKDAISFSPPIPFTLTMKDYHLVLSAEFSPGAQYTLDVKANPDILDGFGLPLQESSFSFTMKEKASYTLQATFEEGYVIQLEKDLDWTVFSSHASQDMCKESYKVVATPVTLHNIKEAIIRAGNTDDDTFMEGGVTVETPDETALQVDVTTVPHDVTNATGLWINEAFTNCFLRQRQKSAFFVSSGDVSVTTIKASSEIFVWTTLISDSTPCEGCQVTLFSTPESKSRSTVTKIGSKTSDGNGLSSFAIPPGFAIFYVVVEHAGRLQLAPPSYHFDDSQTSDSYIIADIILDRGFYVPGDSIHLKGYLRHLKGQFFSTNDLVGDGNFLELQWRGYEFPACIHPVQVSDSGTFNTTIQVPGDVRYGDVSVSLTRHSNPVWASSIFVADPRIATTFMNINSTHSVYKIGSDLTADIYLGTYTGSVISDAPIGITWFVVRNSREKSSAEHSEFGEFSVTSDNYGIARVSVPTITSRLLSPIKVGDQIFIKSRFLSPTKELLEREISFLVVKSDVTLQLWRTVDENTPPHIPWNVYVTPGLVESNPSLEGHILDIEISLFELARDHEILVDESTGKINTRGHPVKSCKISTTVSSFNSVEQFCSGFTFPNMGKYVLVASAQDLSGYTITDFLVIGKSESEWNSDPLKNWDHVTLEFDKEIYSVGDSVKMSFHNPFPKAQVLFFWGNKGQLKTLVTSVTKAGQTDVSFVLGKECMGGCLSRFHLFSGAGNSTDLKVPISRLFDPSGPATIMLSKQIYVTLPVKNVLVQIELASAVVTPGEASEFSVMLSNDRGRPVSGEVAIFIVDKAVLDLKPVPMTSYNESLSQALSFSQEYFSSSSTSVVSFRTYQQLGDLLHKRLSLSPYISESHWSLFDSDTVDLNDSEYFQSFFEAITDFPIKHDDPIDEGRIEALQLSEPAKNALFTSSLTSPSNRSPLFIGTLDVDISGKVVVPWVLPDNIGTFEIRAYAITKDSSFGYAKAEQITRRQLSLQQAIPRVVRVGDSFLAGVTLTSDLPEESLVTVSVYHVCELLTLVGTSNITQTVSRGTPMKIDFRFEAHGTGTADMIFKAEADGIVHDVLVVSQHVAGIQEPVYIATSMAVSASTPSMEGFRLQDSEAFSGILDIYAGVGRLPAITSTGRKIIANMKESWQKNAYSLLSSLVPHIVSSFYSGNLGNLTGCNFETEFKKNLVQLEDFVNPSLGLVYSR